MSYTATTIGFGELPYPFTDAQRLWVTFTIYLSVIGWAYTLGSVVALGNDANFRMLLVRGIFRWRRVLHEVLRAEGPERIAGEWWRGSVDIRDYFRVEDAEGRRFWLFRKGLYGGDAEPRWFMHGLFA
jgi:hypothetical protein